MAYLDENLKLDIKEIVKESPRMFEMFKEGVSHADEAVLERGVKRKMEAMQVTGKIPPHINPKRLEEILRGSGKLLQSYAGATSVADYKRMVKSVTRYLRYIWGALNPEAKQIAAFAAISFYDIQGMPFPF